MKTSKLILCGILLLVTTILVYAQSYAGELYELEDYLEATTGDNPYDDPPPPVRSPDVPSPTGSGPFSPLPNEPVPSNPDNPNSPTNGNSGFYGNGNFNSFGFDNQSFWTNRGNQNQGTRDYLVMAILTNKESLVRSRGRYAKKTGTIFGKNVETVSAVPRFFRKTPDKQVAYQKVQKSIKTPFERCHKTFNVSPSYCYNGIENAFSLTKQNSLLTLCLA